MTGCPYSLIYSAQQTVDRFVAHRSGAADLARAGNQRSTSRSAASHPSTASTSRPDVRIRLDGDRVFVGAGGLGSTRIALNSLSAPPKQVDLQESVQFLVPFVSRRTTGDPRGQRDFTLNQFNLLLKYDDEAYTTSQVHCYPYNPAMAEALPGWLPQSWAGAVLGRITAGLGYLPSWRSPQMRVDLRHGMRTRCRTSRCEWSPTSGRQCSARCCAGLPRSGPSSTYTRCCRWCGCPGRARATTSARHFPTAAARTCSGALASSATSISSTARCCRLCRRQRSRSR